MFSDPDCIEGEETHFERSLAVQRLFDECNVSSDPSLIRSNIQKLLDMKRGGGWDAIGEIPGFSIYKKADECSGDAFEFVFGERVFSDELLEKLNQYGVVDAPQLGDIVFYSGNGFSSIGIYLGDDRVRSKFGFAHVYEHPMRFVPAMYGESVSFLRKKDDSTLSDEALSAEGSDVGWTCEEIEKAVGRAMNLGAARAVTSPPPRYYKH